MKNNLIPKVGIFEKVWDWISKTLFGNQTNIFRP